MEKQRIHWLAPVSMLGALASAAALVCGHHLFYRSLDNKPVSYDSVFGSPISKQQANISIGLAFGFVIKACLVFSMSVAFSQLFWREAMISTSLPTLSHLDSMYSAFDNLISALNVKNLWRYPLLPVVGITAWLIPIASIIAPATLSIEMAAVFPSPTSLMRVPNLDFRSMVFAASLPLMFDFRGTATIGTYLYNGPSQAVAEITNAVMAQGEMAHISPPASNSSWSLDLAAPYVKCENLDSALHQRIRQNVANGMRDSRNSDLFSYLAWLPQTGYYNDDLTHDVPFVSEFEGEKLAFDSGSFPGEGFENITFYVISMPAMFDVSQPEVTRTFNHWFDTKKNATLDVPAWIDGAMLQCVLLNSTYHVFFRYTEGTQEINIEADPTTDRIPPISQILGPNPGSSDDQCQTPTSINSDQMESCYNNANVLRRLSYQAILDAFTANILGSISVDGYQELQRDSAVLNTALVNTQELAFLKTKAAAMNAKNQTLQQMVASSNERGAMGLIHSDASVSKLSLARAIEQMFQNVTISHMSSSLLQPNYSSISAPSNVNVTLPVYQNTYVYSAVKLWAAYGVAIFLASLAVVLGMVTMLLNGASYSNSFSTIFRAARGAGISEKIRDQDLAAEDPLPKYLAGAQVAFAMIDKQQRMEAVDIRRG